MNIMNMNGLGAARRKFSNTRQWREFAAAVQCPITYANAKVIGALRTGRAWIRLDACALTTPALMRSPGLMRE